MNLATVFGTAMTWALVTAVVHAIVVIIRVQVVRGFTLTSDLFMVAAPVAYALIFGVIAILVALLARLAPRLANEARVAGFFAGLAILSVLLLYRSIHPLSWLVLAAAAGWQLSLWFATRERAMRRLRRQVAPVLVVALAINGLAPIAWASVSESRTISGARRADPDAPDVLLLILDTVRARNLGLYGYGRATSPSIDRLAADAVVFDWAFSTASWSLPSHASLFTGAWAHETGGNYLRRVDESLPSVAEVLRDQGYLTAAFMANAGWAGHESGLTDGFLRYVTYRRDNSQLLWSTSLSRTRLGQEVIRGLAARTPMRILKALVRFDLRPGDPVTANLRRGPEIVDSFTRWREHAGDRHPWFAVLNFFDAHAPYRTPYERRFNGGATPVDRYDGGIAYVDEMVGRLAAGLRERGELDRTLIIITSDHGEMFGRHGETAHGGLPYLPVVRVPLVLRYPPRLPPARHVVAVTNADVPATILDIVGADPGLLPGRSLASTSASDTTNLVLFLANRMINVDPGRRATQGRSLGALTDQWHLIVDPDGDEEFYRWRIDSLETDNRAGRPEVAAEQASLRALLQAPSTRRTVR
jgi:arylsulfatase A-like enzyme